MSYNRHGGYRDYDTFSEPRHRTYNRRPQKRKKLRKRTRNRIIMCSAAALIIILLITCLGSCVQGCGKASEAQSAVTNAETGDNANAGENVGPNAETNTLAQAKTAALQYDYETAITNVKSMADYSSNSELQSLVAQWEQEQSELVEFPHEEITHVFFHSLVCEPELAFDGDSKSKGYNAVMTTVDEFNAMMSSMYSKGYVLVSMHDICTFDAQGNRVDHKIMLPQGKKAFVLSQDDVNYYHGQDGDGIATKLILDENGKVKTEYRKLDGQTTVGDFDVVPLLDTFVEQHPDFSYKGHKGILALTAYNGVLGYRTDIVYKTRDPENLDPDQEEFLNANPDFNYEQECAEAKKVAEALKATGWEFASHTWGHIEVPSKSVETISVDHEKWKNYAEAIVGPTDVIIYPYGADVAGIEDYTTDNERFNYLYNQGFRIFCPVDSAISWLQKGDNYFRMGRRNLDGYRMYHEPEKLEDLFDVSQVIDPKRPTPVPTMEEAYS